MALSLSPLWLWLGLLFRLEEKQRAAATGRLEGFTSAAVQNYGFFDLG